ncbi:hypothetical protein QBC45DRAFT_398846 [Copromyces sp. CBS 386.78]|nr:hypothetical protein QBC45DRAFT_398846 [Copromyces sp. CBS 386.78]
MPAIPILRLRTRRLPASTNHHIDLGDDINTYLPLQLRDPSPRGGGGHSSGHSSGGRSSSSRGSSSHGSSSSSHGSSSSSSSDKSHGSSSSSTNVVVVGGGPRYYGPHNNLLLPVWAIILIVVLVFETTLFCVALGWFHKEAKAELKRLYPSEPRPQLKYGRIWLNAFIIASWLWLPIAIYNVIMERVIEPRKGIKKERKLFGSMVPNSTNTKIESAASTAYKGAGVGAGAGVDAELMNGVMRTNSAYSKIPASAVEEVGGERMKYDTPKDVKVPFEEKKYETEAALPYPSGGAFAGYAPAPVPTPAPAAEPQQGAAASYFTMSQPQSQNLSASNPLGRQ